MTMEMEGLLHTPSSREKPPRPLSLLISFLRENGGSIDDASRHIRHFIDMLNDVGYEEFRDAVLDEWARIKYTTAYSAAHPPTAAELKRRHEDAKKAARAERKAIAAAKLKIVKHALATVMPNGKTLAKCAREDIQLLGGLFAKIAERLKPKQLVGDVFTNREIVRLAAQTK